MSIKNGLIYLLGGYTDKDYKDQSELLDRAMKGWQSSKEMNERLMKKVTETSEKYTTILRFIGDTFGNPNRSKDDILSACKEMLDHLDNVKGS